ncbi:hypothetical protein V2J09_009631 [Rumex salicifolius]
MEEDATKIRKSRCSPSSSTSSFIHNHRPKKAALVRKRGAGSTTPVPTWRLVASRSPSISLRIAASAETPRSKSGRSTAAQMQPVSARKLAATLWELNEVPAPTVKDGRRRRRERVESFSSLLPPHLSDPSHSPISEKSDRSGIGTHRRRQSSSFSRKHRSNAPDIGVLDSVSNASFMEIETRSRCQSQTPAMSTAGSRNSLKEINNALTTSKELLKIISRMWVHEDNKPSSSTSLISALHTELERARLQVNQLVQEQRSERNEVNYLLQCFAEEKAAWRSKEKESIRATIESFALELEAERKLRRRIESMNKKLGKELGETKALFSEALKELENEKRERGVIEQVCNDLAWNVGEDKARAEDLKRESLRMRDEIEKEREMLHIADALREERAHMKLSEAKHHFEEKNAAVDQLRDELETFLKDERGVIERTHLPYFNEEKELDGGEVEDGVNYGDDSGDSDLHSIELNMNRSSKGNRLGLASVSPRISKKLIADEELIGRGQRRSSSLLRSVSNVVESLQSAADEKFSEVHRRSCGDELQRSKTVKGIREHVLSSSRMRPSTNAGSPGGQWGLPWAGGRRRH